MTNQQPAPLILVADDQKPTAIMLERVFSFEGYRVECVFDGIAAVEAAKRLQPDLMLLDINMPGLDGFEVLEKLRDDPKTENIPMILITAMGDSSHVVQGLNLGADDYLKKPFHPQELLARAESKMKSRQLEEKLQQRTLELETLLRVSDALNSYLDFDQLLEVILYFALDLGQCEATAVCYMDDNGSIIARRHYTIEYGISEDFNVDQELWAAFLNAPHQREICLLSKYPYGISIPIQTNNALKGVLMAGNPSPFSHFSSNLLLGLASQASLAFQNAELYNIKAKYADQLEQEVRARTRELESAQGMLVRAEKLASIGRLAAAIAHEVNNPLFPIRLDLEGIIEDIKSDIPIQTRDIEHILSNVDRIKNTVDRLLGFTGNKQADSARFEQLDINTVIEDIVQLNHKLLQRARVDIELNLSPLPYIFGNRYQLEYVFMNLTLNAIDAMPQGGKLAFITKQQGGHVIVKAQDNGEGIPEDIIDTIFEPFISTKEDGNGLGLYISYDIMQKHHGDIFVNSKVNEGTQFTLKLAIPQIESN